MNYIAKPGTTLTKDYIVEKFCTITNLTIDQLSSRSRKREIVNKRHILFWILRNKTNLKLSEIATILNRDHATVVWSNKTINQFIEMDDYLGKEALETLKKIEQL